MWICQQIRIYCVGPCGVEFISSLFPNHPKTRNQLQLLIRHWADRTIFSTTNDGVSIATCKCIFLQLTTCYTSKKCNVKVFTHFQTVYVLRKWKKRMSWLQTNANINWDLKINKICVYPWDWIKLHNFTKEGPRSILYMLSEPMLTGCFQP